MRIALTGGIGSGKSTVAALLRDLGAVVIDSDVIAREVVEPGTPGLARIVEEFGPQMLTRDGRLDRPRLGELVFSDPGARSLLNAIVHPLVRERSAELAAAAPEGALVVQDIPLLVETGQRGSFDAVLVVDAPEEVQVQRLVGQRGLTEEDARARISAQVGREARLAAATHVIDNSGPESSLRARVEEVFAEITQQRAS